MVILRVLNLLILRKRMVTYVPKVFTALRAPTPQRLVQEVLLVQVQEILKLLNASSAPLALMVMILVLLLASLVVAPHAPRLAQRVASVLVLIVFTSRTPNLASANLAMCHLMEPVPTLTALLIAKKRYMQDALPDKNKTYMETVKIRLLAKKNAMVDLERFRVDWEYASAIMLKTLMIFAMTNAEPKLKKFHSQLMVKFRFMILQLELQQPLHRKYNLFFKLI